jgi:hypothetical protein
MRAVNLLPKDDGRRGKVGVENNNPALVGGVAGVVLVTAILAFWFLTASTGVADKQKRFDAVQAELAATPVPPPNAPGSSALAQEKTARIAALSTALSSRLAWDRGRRSRHGSRIRDQRQDLFARRSRTLACAARNRPSPRGRPASAQLADDDRNRSEGR